ncbi:MAG: hypothetical protein RR359_00355 [Bacilli bacterium]
MKRKTTSILIISTLLIILMSLLTNSNIVILTVIDSFYMFINNVFPTLFVFFIISDLLINFGFSELISELFKNSFAKIFNIKKESVYIFIISLISGFPGSSKYIKDMLDNGLIDIKDATKLLTFTHFSNPLFIIGTIGISFLNNKFIGFLILIAHYLGAIIVGILFRNFYKKEITMEKVSFYFAINNMHKKRISNHKFIKILSNSILNAFNTLTLIFGLITVFSLINNIFINNFITNNYFKIIISGLLEFTNGLKLLSISNLNMLSKALLACSFISFGGFCVHLQVFSILSDYNINYFTYLCSRIVHLLISFIILIILFMTLY